MDILEKFGTVNDGLVALAKANFSYNDISGLLFKYHGVHLSRNAIGKRLRRLGVLSRRGQTVHSEIQVRLAALESLQNLPETVGYRSMTTILRRRGLHVRRDMVMTLMRDIDQNGIALRRRRRIQRRIYTSIGPNHVWHVDGYDKLKPHGFAIHGCIDGYSRKVMWLTVGPSNNDPRIVATNFVRCVMQLKGCPLVLQADPGTENVVMGALQCVFRHAHNDCFSGANSFRVVRSVFNQRIEAWWSMLRRRQTQSWIFALRDLECNGHFHRGNEKDTYCLRFCLMPLIQKELDSIVDEWNHHYVSFSRQASCPNGRPDVLYSLCENTGGSECIQSVTDDDSDWAITECTISSRTGSFAFDDIASNTFQRNGWIDALTWPEAIRNYMLLSNAV